MIVVFGSLNIDLVLATPHHPQAGETVLCSASTLSPGGKGCNQAVAAARAGGNVAMAGRVGADAFGDMLVAALKANAVDTTCIGRANGLMTGCAAVAVDAAGENVIFVASGANGAACAADVPELMLQRAGVVVTQMEVSPEQTLCVLQRAKAAGAVTVLNFAPAHDADADLVAGIRNCVDVLVVNGDEAVRIAAATGVDAETHSGALARRLARALECQCIITLGADGVCAATHDEQWAIPALQVEVTDTTGAGDTFIGALAVMLDENRPPPYALRFATVAASLACRAIGAQQGMPLRAHIEQQIGN